MKHTASDIMILCGGLGTRLQPVLDGQPKALAPINGTPFIDLLIRYYHRHGFSRFILCTGHKSDLIKAYFENNSIPDVDIVYSEEPSPLLTGGAIKHALRHIKSDHFMVLNGDSFCDINHAHFFQFHSQKNATISIALTQVDNANRYGMVTINNSGSIQKFEEKKETNTSGLINAGIYLINTLAMTKKWPKEPAFSIEKTLFPILSDQHLLFGIALENTTFIDIGTPESLTLAEKILNLN